MPASIQLPLEVAGRLGELGEDQHLVPLQHRVGLQQLDQRLELVVVLRLELAQLVEEVGDLVQVVERLVDDLVDVVLLAVQVLDTSSSISSVTMSSSASSSSSSENSSRCLLVDVADQFLVPESASVPGGASRRSSRVLHDEGQELAQQTVAGALEGVGGTLEALEELGADQADDLLLAALDELDPIWARSPL